ncbi:hypothetical protein TeGR_g3130 [Tetraparma gracilis]|uniref:Uncharacterized protein n=1 Tax=Tetraparma gracilis TaxID=2962635 RepID=A0ABQ6M5S8_9STRA|nr:hypothetical protein TeGR_g3130 [Tetraparma gracilis]
MSKAGDLPGLQEFAAAHPEFDFVSSRDAFQSSCLYYGCHCGAIKTPQIVFWLLSKGTYSERELARCRDNAINANVKQMLLGLDVAGAEEGGAEVPELSPTGMLNMFGADEGGGDY